MSYHDFVQDRPLILSHLAQVPHHLSGGDMPSKQAIGGAIEQLKALDATLVAHYYTPASVQMLAKESGGFVGDSLEMARFGMNTPASRVIVAGVRFMGETAKILSPAKPVYLIDQASECSLELTCPIEAYQSWRDEHADRTALVYANTSAAVKAASDWVVTSSNALKIVSMLHAKGDRMLWASDRHLGRYIQSQTGADMLIWNGACVVHEEFQAQALEKMKKQHPKAAILAHPESPEEVLDLADVVGSTSQLLKAAKNLSQETLIVATDAGLFYQMQLICPSKTLLRAPTQGSGGSCQSCAYCPWMSLNRFNKLLKLLEDLTQNESQTQDRAITLSHEIIQAARRPLDRMLSVS